MNLPEKIAKLSDLEAERCLNALLKQIAEERPVLQEVFTSPVLVTETIKSVGDQTGTGAVSEDAIKDRPGAIRAILEEAANNPILAPRLEAWLSDGRRLLIEPITTTLILAGVVLVLSTHVKIEYEKKDGKKHLKIKVEKKASSESIIKKVLSFAHLGGK